MRQLHWRSERARYTFLGAVFGAVFPVVAFLTMTFVSRGSNFLFGVICTAPFFLGSVARLAGLRQDRLNEINKGLEDLVAERTSSIQSMLDLSGQGFFSFGADLIIKPEYSKECERIFGRSIQGCRVDELLYSDRAAAQEFCKGLRLCFSGGAKPEVIFDLLDHELQIADMTIHAEYRAVTTERIMVTLTDVTEELRLQKRVRAEDERNDRVLRAIKHKADFGSFARDAERVLADMGGQVTNVESLLREVHTFKGNAGFFGFRKTQDAAHEIEDYITDSAILGEKVSFDGKVDRLRGIFAEELQAVTGTLGTDWMRDVDSIVVPKSAYLRIEGHVIRRHPTDYPLIRTLEGYRKQPLVELFARFPQMATDLAAKRGKRILPLEITGGTTRVIPERYRRLVSSFGHLIRNMIDHGVETPAEREKVGKPPEGRLGIDIRDDDKEIVFQFSDDGHGIEFDKIEERARALGLIRADEHPPTSKLIEYIFQDSFSTAANVTVVSGRGVGLSAVRQSVRELGGRISIATHAGRGTVFTVTVRGGSSRSNGR